MANEQHTELQDLTAEELKDRATNIVEENKNLVGGVILVLLVVIVGGYWYSQSSKESEALAQAELYKANLYLQKDSFNLALKGRTEKGQADNFIGYADIIQQYGGTNASNLAHYYAGIATLKIGKPELALDYLGNFSGEEMLQAQAYNLMGDAASELGNYDAALGHYDAAAGYTENVSLQLFAKFKAGKVLEKQGKNEDAKKYFQEIMDTDSKIAEGLGVDKDLIRL